MWGTLTYFISVIVSYSHWRDSLMAADIRSRRAPLTPRSGKEESAMRNVRWGPNAVAINCLNTDRENELDGLLDGLRPGLTG